MFHKKIPLKTLDLNLRPSSYQHITYLTDMHLSHQLLSTCWKPMTTGDLVEVTKTTHMVTSRALASSCQDITCFWGFALLKLITFKNW